MTTQLTVQRPPLARYEVLLSALIEAEAGVRAGLDPLLCGLNALHAVIEFLTEDPMAKAGRLHLPLTQVANAIHDVTKGAKPKLLYERMRRAGRPTNTTADMTARGAIAAAVQVLIDSGLKRDEAAQIVVREANSHVADQQLRRKVTKSNVLRWRAEVDHNKDSI